MAAVLYAPQAVELVLERTGPISREIDMKRIEILHNVRYISTIQNNLKWDNHVLDMVSKANSRKSFYLGLERLGVGLTDLVKCYRTFVRPQL